VRTRVSHAATTRQVDLHGLGYFGTEVKESLNACKYVDSRAQIDDYKIRML